MNMIFMSAEEAKYNQEANIKLFDKIAAAFKKYCEENSEIMLASLAVLNGNVPYRCFEMLRKNA